MSRTSAPVSNEAKLAALAGHAKVAMPSCVDPVLFVALVARSRAWLPECRNSGVGARCAGEDTSVTARRMRRGPCNVLLPSICRIVACTVWASLSWRVGV